MRRTSEFRHNVRLPNGSFMGETMLKTHRRRIILIAGLLGFFMVVGGTTVFAEFGGQTIVSPDGGAEFAPLYGSYGLSGFHFDYKGSDRHVRTIAAGLDSCAITLGCAPNTWYANYADGGSPLYTVDIAWQSLPPGTRFGSRESFDIYGGAGINMLLGPATPGTVPVLTGFSVFNQNGDMHLMKLSVKVYTDPDFGYNYAEVNFLDDGDSVGLQDIAVSYAVVPADHVEIEPMISGHSAGKVLGKL